MRDNKKQFYVGVIIFIIVLVAGFVLRNLFDKTKYIDFNNDVIALNNQISKELTNFHLSFAKTDIKKEDLENTRLSNLALAKQKKDELSKLKVPNGGDDLLLKANNMFSFYIDMLEKDYIKAIDYRFKENFSSNTNLQEALLKILVDITNKQQSIAIDFLDSQKAFVEDKGLDFRLD